MKSSFRIELKVKLDIGILLSVGDTDSILEAS